MNETKELARLLVELKYEDIPQAVIKKTEELTLDQFGVETFAATKPWCRAVYEQVKDLRSTGGATVLNYGDKMAIELAAFVNGTFGHGFELDDTYTKANLHPGCVLVPAAMAMGEVERIDGKRLLLALVAGYEAMGRVAKSMWPSFIGRGHHPTASAGPFGSAAVVGKILGYSPELMEDALGIAASMGSGTTQFSIGGGSLKRIYGGIGAQGGVKAALLAGKGLTAPRNAIEGDWGFGKAFSDTFRPEEITADFGKTWVAPEIVYKRYPTDYMLQALLDALLQLMQEHHIKASDVRQVLAGSNKVAFRVIGAIKEPKEISGAQFSAAFCLGLALLKGSFGPEDLVDANLTNPDILAEARKVTLELDEEVQAAYPAKRAGRVKLVLNNGTTYSRTIMDLKGTPDNPMTREEIEAKFRSLAGAVLKMDKVEQVTKAMRDLEHLKDVSRLARLLVA